MKKKKIICLITFLFMLIFANSYCQFRNNWLTIDESIGFGFVEDESIARWEGFIGWENSYIGRIGVFSMGYGQDIESDISAVMVGGKYEFPIKLIKESNSTNISFNLGIKYGPMVGTGVADYALSPSGSLEFYWYSGGLWDKIGIAIAYDHLLVDEESFSNLSLHLIQSF